MKIDNPMTGFSSAIDLSSYKQSTINQDVKNKLNELTLSPSEKTEPSLSVKTSITLVDNTMREERSGKLMTEQLTKYLYEPNRKSNDAMLTMDRQFGKIEIEVDKAFPNLKNVGWDFVLKDGKFNVVSDKLKANEKAWIESKLNSDGQLLRAANEYSQAVVAYYQDEPERFMAAGTTGDPASALGPAMAYENVAKDIEGKITFKDLLEKGAIMGRTSHGNTPKVFPLDYAKGFLTKSVVIDPSRYARLIDEFA